MAINNVLKELGLTEKETEVYICLVKNGKMTPTSLSKLTNINRASVYNITKSLISKGIIAEDSSAKIVYFSPLPPSSIEQIIKRPMRELQQKEDLVKKAIDELSLIGAGNQYPIPTMRFVEEKDVENYLYENIEKWQKSAIETDETWWGLQDYTFIEQFPKFSDWYWKQPLSKKINMYQVSNDSEAERTLLKKVLDQNRDVRFSDDMKFTSSVWVGGDYIIMITTRQHPFYLYEIHDRVLAGNLSQVFKKLWNQSKSNTQK